MAHSTVVIHKTILISPLCFDYGSISSAFLSGIWEIICWDSCCCSAAAPRRSITIYVKRKCYDVRIRGPFFQDIGKNGSVPVDLIVFVYSKVSPAACLITVGNLEIMYWPIHSRPWLAVDWWEQCCNCEPVQCSFKLRIVGERRWRGAWHWSHKPANRAHRAYNLLSQILFTYLVPA